ncbi:hypothetical protein SmJEL517_g01529 [Synchytrium microbalum]|uniref:Mediator of RNA polymerase II transcription subunit 7 n=1 Tax=Synchytrium microbalum TaxID=1806994 RepID=A0A507CE51_9FUNG|nr:uncharacterized protein SmJEL517_g01529 [Synchytrium microbalum]TPX36204.1 hypothetical protein SmJEL517_g01529 [Synchytrium microbalum]
MAAQGDTRPVSAFPHPPPYYTYFTDANTAAVENGNQAPDVVRRFLTPPEPITGKYQIFGRWTDVQIQSTTLADRNIKQLYPDGPIDRRKELQSLNESLLANFVELLDVLVRHPKDYAVKVADIHTVLQNMHHLINDYRPHQARDTLQLMEERQIRRRKATTEEINRACDEVQTILDSCKSLLMVPAPMTVDTTIQSQPEQPQQQQQLNRSEQVQALLDAMKTIESMTQT